MSVEIKVDLDASQAYGELAQLEVLLKSLGHDMRDLDLNLGESLGGISDEIQQMVDALEDAEDRLGRMARDMSIAAEAWEDVDFGIHQFPSVEGGSSIGDDPPGRGDGAGKMAYDAATRRDVDLAQGIESLFGLDFGSVSKVDDIDADKFRDAIADFHNLVNHGETFNLKGASLPGDVQPMRGAEYVHDGRFGLEPASMAAKRRKYGADLDFEDFPAAGNFPKAPKVELMELFGFDKDSNASLANVLDGFEDRIKRIMPTMKKWWQLIALLIPLLIALVPQILGVVAALGAMAVAGAAVIGVGLLGHAQSMEESFAAAKREVQDFKRALFEVFQPTAQTFAPISGEFMDFAPTELESVARAMQDLVVYEDLIFNMFSGLSGGLEEFVNILVQNQVAIEHLSRKYGGLIGSGLLEFFEWLIQAAYRNQAVLDGLGRIIVKIAVALYNVSMAVSTVLTTFEPFFTLLVWISELINSEIVIGLITMVSWLFVLGKIALFIKALYGAFMTLVTGMKIASLMMLGYQMTTWGAVAATLALVAAVGMLNLGASAVIGGIVTGGAMVGTGAATGAGGPNFAGGGVGPGAQVGGMGTTVVNNYNYNLENHGPMDSSTQQGFRSQFKRFEGESQAMKPPEVETSATSSKSNVENAPTDGSEGGN